MSATPLKPWSQVVSLHSDVERGETAIASYAIDLGALVKGNTNVPRVYREAGPFFAATYLTKGLRDLLAEVLGRLSGEPGDRVLQLHSPFGGGKSHTLAALFHAARDPAALRALPEAGSLPDPGPVRVVVFDGEKFDVLGGKVIGQNVRTLWGALAAGLGCYDLLAYHDENRVAPGGDKIAEMLGNEPTLLLLDEVLKYLVRGQAATMKEQVASSTLGAQTQEFLQTLATEVAGSSRAVMVYSLQSSAREAYGYEALLNALDHLVSRVDAKREPVKGDEVLMVLQRRLLSSPPPRVTAEAVAAEYANQITRMRAANSASDLERRHAEDERFTLERRLREAYPFHPALIDVMWERWSAIPEFQRTRGALRFLAQNLHVLKRDNKAGLLLGAGDIPIEDDTVRRAFFTEVGQREIFEPAMQSDFIGPMARIRRIDDRLTDEHPQLASVRPAMRLATAILAYSFGGRRQSDEAGGDPVGMGVSESELMDAVVGPELDSLTAGGVLKQLREQCLYLHFDGARYGFKTTPNISYLIEQANVPKAEVDGYIEKSLSSRLSGRIDSVLWPVESSAIPDKEMHFLLVYLPLDFASKPRGEQEKTAVTYFTQRGQDPRHYRNSLGLAVPESRQVDQIRQAARTLLAIERVLSNRNKHNLTISQGQQLNERKKGTENAFEAAMRSLYERVWLPQYEGNKAKVDEVSVTGRPLTETGLHEKLMSLLTQVMPPRVFITLQPHKLVELMRLGSGENESGAIDISKVVDSFFRTPGFPRLHDEKVVRNAVVAGVESGLFGYVRSANIQESAMKETGGYLANAEHVTIDQRLSPEQIDIAAGFLIIPSAIAPEPEPEPVPGTSADTGEGVVKPQPAKPGTPSTTDFGSSTYTVENEEESDNEDSNGEGKELVGPLLKPPKKIQLRLRANRQQIYAMTNALSNLADHVGVIYLTVEAERSDRMDDTWLRNAVIEPLDEADVLLSNEP